MQDQQILNIDNQLVNHNNQKLANMRNNQISVMLDNKNII